MDIHLYFSGSPEDRATVDYFFKNLFLCVHFKVRILARRYQGAQVEQAKPAIYYLSPSDLQGINGNNSIHIPVLPAPSHSEQLVQGAVSLRAYPSQHTTHIYPCISEYDGSQPRESIFSADDDTYIYSVPDNRIYYTYDLLSQSAYMLSCSREKDQNPSSHTSFYQNTAFFRDGRDEYGPTVTQQFALFALVLRRLLPGAAQVELYPGNKTFALCLTHDVDGIDKGVILNMKRAAVEVPNAYKHIRHGDYRRFWEKIRRTAGFVLSRNDYFLLDAIQQEESKYGAYSTFFVYSRVTADWLSTKGRVLRALYDPRYSVQRDGRIQRSARRLIDTGNEIGLHGSAFSYNNREALMSERAALEKAIGHTVQSLRQHFLRISLPEVFAILEDTGLDCDSTQSFNDYFGYRAHTMAPYYGYNHRDGRPSCVMEFPMPIMDSMYFDFFDYDKDTSWEILKRQLQLVKDLRGCVCVNWHQRTFSKDFGWADTYYDILRWACENDGYLGTVGSIYEKKCQNNGISRIQYG